MICSLCTKEQPKDNFSKAQAKKKDKKCKACLQALDHERDLNRAAGEEKKRLAEAAEAERVAAMRAAMDPAELKAMDEAANEKYYADKLREGEVYSKGDLRVYRERVPAKDQDANLLAKADSMIQARCDAKVKAEAEAEYAEAHTKKPPYGGHVRQGVLCYLKDISPELGRTLYYGVARIDIDATCQKVHLSAIKVDAKPDKVEYGNSGGSFPKVKDWDGKCWDGKCKECGGELEEITCAHGDVTRGGYGDDGADWTTGEAFCPTCSLLYRAHCQEMR